MFRVVTYDLVLKCRVPLCGKTRINGNHFCTKHVDDATVQHHRPGVTLPMQDIPDELRPPNAVKDARPVVHEDDAARRRRLFSGKPSSPIPQNIQATPAVLATAQKLADHLLKTPARPPAPVQPPAAPAVVQPARPPPAALPEVRMTKPQIAKGAYLAWSRGRGSFTMDELKAAFPDSSGGALAQFALAAVRKGQLKEVDGRYTTQTPPAAPPGVVPAKSKKKAKKAPSVAAPKVVPAEQTNLTRLTTERDTLAKRLSVLDAQLRQAVQVEELQLQRKLEALTKLKGDLKMLPEAVPLTGAINS